MTEHTAEIVDVFKDTVRVPVEDVRTGDCVFDIYGGRHAVKSVTRRGARVTIRRVDGWTSRHAAGDTITVIRASR